MSRTYIRAELRRQVVVRAKNCCEYCLISQENNFLPFEIDHIVAEKHNGETVADNLCLSCSTCNGYKGSDIGSYDVITKQLTPLYNPRTERWHTHFKLDGVQIVPMTAVGRVTVAILTLNSVERLKDREGLRRLGAYPCAVASDF